MTMKAYPLFRYSNVLENIGVKASKNPTTDDSGSPSTFTVERTQSSCFRIKSKIPCLSIKRIYLILYPIKIKFCCVRNLTCGIALVSQNKVEQSVLLQIHSVSTRALFL